MVERHEVSMESAHQASPFTRTWLWLSVGAALLAVAGSLIGLLLPSIYALLTQAFLPQAIAQDLANLFLVSPMLLLLTALALRGSLRAYLLWLGVLIFTVYNYVIYTFSVPFGPLFMLWVAVLGLSVYALIGGIASADHTAIRGRYTSTLRAKVTAWVLILAASLFGLLWLSEDVPALLSATTPPSLVAMGVPTNPVHILDLAFFLPAAILTSVMVLRRNPLGFTLAPAFIVFMLLTGIPILVTPAVQSAVGQIPAWGVMVPIGVFTVGLAVLLGWLLASIRDRA